MPGPTWNFQPNGPGWDRRDPYEKLREQMQWSPAPVYPAHGAVAVTEVGGAMRSRGRGMNGMGDMFTYPQGADPSAYYQQQIAPAPAALEAQIVVEPEIMDESALYRTAPAHRDGSMPWESSMAPWDAPRQGVMQALAPSAAPAAIAAMNAGRSTPEGRQRRRRKAIEAAQGAKVAADNAVRAAKAGAPQIAATNAATAQAAANVAAGVADDELSQQAASIAKTEATRAIAAANVAASNGSGLADWMELQGRGRTGRGMADWMELQGMRGLGGMGSMSFLERPLVGSVKVKHAVYGGVAVALVLAIKKYME